MANTVQLNLTVKDDGSVVLDKFVDTAKKGSTEAAKAASSASGSFTKFGASVVSINSALELTQQVARLAGAAFDFIAGGAQKTGEEYLRLSQQTGLTVEEISSMSLAAATADVSQEALALSTKKLSINMVDAASGGKESQAAFAALGVETKNADGTLRSVNDVFLDTVDALGAIQNESERTAASQAVFGRSSQELAALIADGSGKIREQAELAAKLGLVWSGPAAQAADELGDQTTILKAAIKGMSDEIGAKAIPSLTSMVSATNDWIVANREAISQNIDRIFAAAATAADLLADAARGVAGAINDVIDAIPGLRKFLSTVQDLAGEWLDLNVQARAAEKATNDVGRAFIGASKALTEAKQDLADYNLAIRDAGQLYPDQIAKQKALEQAVRDAQGAYDAAEAALDKSVTKGEQAARVNDFLGQSLATLRDKASLSEAAVARFAQATGLSTDEVRKLDAGVKPGVEQVHKLALAFGKTDEEIRKALPGSAAFAAGMKKTGDEAGKTAQSIAQLAQQGSQYAAAQLEQVAATGDLARTQEAYQAAIDAAGKALQANLAVADAAAAAGKSEAEVTALRTKAEQDFATAANAAADKVGAAYQREQSSQEALAATTADLQVAHDLEALAAANAAQVGAVYAKTVEDIEDANRQAVAAIEAKRGVTLNDAEAEKAVAEANEKTRQQLAAAEQQYRATTAAADAYGQVIDDIAGHLAEASLDVGLALLGGQISWKDAGKQLAADFTKEALDEVKAILLPGMKDVFKTVFDSLVTDTGIKSSIADVGKTIVSGLSSLIGSSGGEVATAVQGATNNSEVLNAALSGGTSAGGSAVSGITSALGAAGAVGAVAAAGFGLFQVFAAVFGGPSAKDLMARRIKETLTDALTSDEVVSALNEAAAELGFGFSESMVGAIAGINTSITKTISARIPIQIYPDIFFNKDEFNRDVQALISDTGITDEFAAQILSGGPVIGGSEDFFKLIFGVGPGQLSEETARYLGDIAAAAGIAAADIEKVFGKERSATIESFGAGLANLGYQLGLTAEETQQMIEEFNTAIGAPQAAVLAFRELDDELRAELGTGDQYQSMMQSVTDRLRGLGVEIPKRVKSLGDLRDAFLQAGMPADQFAKLVKAAMEDAGISVDQFGDDWASITAALVDPQVQGIDEVIADVQRLGGLSPLMDDLSTNFQDMFDAFAPGGFDSSELTVIGEQLSKLATLPPDALAGMSGQLHDMFVEIARANDLTLPQVAEMFRGKIPDSVLQSVMAVQSFGQELGLLSGESNTSLREVEDDFRRLAGEVLDSSGELTAFGETLNKQLQAGISGLDQAIADEMGSAGQVSADTTAQVMYQLAELMKLPPEQLSDSTKQAIDQLKADLMAALNLTSEQVDAMIAQAASAPPPVPTGTTKALDDATASTDSLTTSTTDAAAATSTLTGEIDKLIAQGTTLGAAGTSVTEALGLTPEGAAAVEGIAAGLSDAATVSTDMATAMQGITEAVSGSTDEFATLAQAAGLSSEQVQAALAGVIGTVEDGQSLAAFDEMLANTIPVSLDELTQGVLGSTGTWHDSFDYARGGVLMLHEAIDAVPTDKTITFHIVQDGEIPTGGDDGGGDGHAAGHWKVPGPAGKPFRTILHGGERVLSVEEDREYQRIRFGAAGAAAATAGPMMYAAPSASTRAPSTRAIANEVIRSLTDSGRLHVLLLQSADLGALTEHVGREVALNILPRLSRGGAVKADTKTGEIRRNTSHPGG